MSKTIPFQTIQFSLGTQFKWEYSLIVKNISISSYSVQSNSSNWNNSVLHKYVVSSIQPIDRALSGATILGQSGPGSNGNEGVLCIPQNSSITGTLPSVFLVSYLGHSFVCVLWGGLIPLQRCSRCILEAPADWGKYD